MSLQMRIRLALCSSVLLATSFGNAQDIPEPFQLTFGMGLVRYTAPYIGSDAEVRPFPILTPTYGRWTEGLLESLSFTAVSSGPTQLDFGVRFMREPELPDTPLFSGLDRDDGFEPVAAASCTFPEFGIETKASADLSSAHDGFRADLSIGRSASLGGLLIEGRIGAEYLDGNYGLYLYRVSAGEANALRSADRVGSAWLPRLELSAARPMSDTTSLVGFVEHQWLSYEIHDSPLVDDDSLTTVGLTLNRRF